MVVLLEKIVEIVIIPHIQLTPIVHSGAPQISVVRAETQRADKMQNRASGNASSTNVAGIGWNFRLQQHHIHFRNFRHKFCHNYNAALLEDISSLSFLENNASKLNFDRTPGIRSINWFTLSLFFTLIN